MVNRKNKKKLSKRRILKKIRLRFYKFFKKYPIEKYAIMLVCYMAALLMFQMRALDLFELTLLDARFRIRPPSSVNDKIVLINIAQDSIEHIGRWPWDRSWHATLIMALNAFNVQAVFYDVVFSEPSNHRDDVALREAIMSSGNVYLPYILNVEGLDSRYSITGDNIYGVSTSIGSLKVAAKGTGFINMLPDVDGILRRVPLIIEYENKRYLQAAFKLALDILDVREEDIIVKRSRYIRLPVRRNANKSYIDIPIDENYQMLINWPGRWKYSFRHFSFYDTVKSFSMIHNNEKPIIPVERLNNAICIVGMVASGLLDAKPTPLELLYPAMGINAIILDNILRSNFCAKASDAFNATLIAIMVFLIVCLISSHYPVRNLLILLALLACYIIVAIALFSLFGIWVNIIYSVVAILITYLGLTAYNEIRIVVEKKRFFNFAITDALTGLYRKSHFNILMKTALSDRRMHKDPGALSVIMADIDYFKRVNDMYGHLFGDFVLKKVAKAIKLSCRPLDVCVRYGGEEFIIMLPNTTGEEATAIAERIRKTVAKKVFKYMKKSCHITISLGVANLKQQDNQQLLINRADTALYAAKANGRNRVCG
jgi:diguanylate cyclase (GGDEF)-like protein